MSIEIWHNNRCAKSRDAKNLLLEQNVPHGTFEYLKENITEDMIKNIMIKLNINDIKDMLRPTEVIYKNLDIKSKSQEEILSLVVQYPKLIQRPIIIKDKEAVIARPIEKLINLLK